MKALEKELQGFPSLLYIGGQSQAPEGGKAEGSFSGFFPYLSTFSLWGEGWEVVVVVVLALLFLLSLANP